MTLLNNDSETINEAFGISEERFDELKNILRKTAKDLIDEEILKTWKKKGKKSSERGRILQ